MQSKPPPCFSGTKTLPAPETHMETQRPRTATAVLKRMKLGTLPGFSTRDNGRDPEGGRRPRQAGRLRKRTESPETGDRTVD